MEIELIEKIEQYINGELNITQLESYASSNQIVGLEEKINWVKNTGLAIEQEGLRDQMSKLFHLESEKKPTRIISLARTKWTVGIAASLLILITGYWLNFGPDSNSFSKYDFMDPGIPVVMSESKNYELYDALSYYSEANYATTIQKLSLINERGINNDTIQYYLGASHLYEGNYGESINYLNHLSGNPNSDFIEKAEWLTILNYLKLKDYDEVKTRLSSILKKQNHEFFDMAHSLNQKLQN